MKIGVKKKVLDLCDSTNVKVGRLEREIKLANGTISRWSEDTYPNSQTLAAIADFFGVTTDWLLDREEEIDITDELERLHKDPQLKMLLSSSAKLNKDDLKFLQQLADRMNQESGD